MVDYLKGVCKLGLRPVCTALFGTQQHCPLIRRQVKERLLGIWDFFLLRRSLILPRALCMRDEETEIQIFIRWIRTQERPL